MCVYTLYIATNDGVTITFKYYIHCFLKEKGNIFIDKSRVLIYILYKI